MKRPRAGASPDHALEWATDEATNAGSLFAAAEALDLSGTAYGPASLPRLPESARARPGQHPGIVLFLLSTAVFMASLDLFIVNVALTAIGRDVGSASLSSLSWTLNAYAIVYAALLVPAGRLADRYGRKTGFVLGLGIFSAASLGCALSGTLWVLVGFRCMQAAGAAVLTPTSLGLVLTVLPAERRERAVRIWASSGSLAAAVGPVVGGLLVEASWRWVFVLNVPIGVAALAMAIAFVPSAATVAELRLPDLLGGVILMAAIGTLALGLVQAPVWGWGFGWTWGCLAVTAAMLALFLWRSARHSAPILDLSLFRLPSFAWANVSAVLFSVAFAMALLSLVLWLQEGWHWSGLATGLAIAPGPCMVWPFALVGQRLTRWVPASVVAAAGTLLLGIGPVVIQTSVGSAPFHVPYALAILPGWLVGGIGVGLALPTILATATADLAPHQTATGSAVVNMSRQIGAVIGTSMLVLLLGAATSVAGTHAGTASSNALHTVFLHAAWVIGGIGVVGAFGALRMMPRHAIAVEA